MVKFALTLIDNKDMRGALAPSNSFSRELFEKMVDFLELSSAASQKETAKRLRSPKWLPAQDVHAKAKKAR